MDRQNGTTSIRMSGVYGRQLAHHITRLINESEINDDMQ